MSRCALLSGVLAASSALAQADLTVGSVTAPATAALGSTITLSATLRNVGSAPVGGEFKYTWFLSSDRAVTISDLPLATAMNPDVAAATAVTVTSAPLTLPPGLTVGPWFFGVCVNYDPQGTPRFGTGETNLTNDCAAAGTATVFSSPQLDVVTPASLPGATQFAPWGVQLEAQGGNGSYTWSLASGSSLPLGVRLEQSALLGSPSLAGTFTFTVQVQSGTVMASRALTLVVLPGAIPLTLAQQSLPSAEYGRVYEVPLLATGGKPPYRWTAARVPQGLQVQGDGFVTGVPQATGDFPFDVTVTDADQATASGTITLKVVAPFTLHLGVTTLATAYLERDYVQPLVAVGGKPPYTWSAKIQSLPQDITQVPGEVIDLPPEFGLRLENGALRGVAKQAGLYAVTLTVSDANSAQDATRLLLLVSYAEPIQLKTTMLPDAFIGNDYLVHLSRNRIESTGVTYSLPCVQVQSQTAGQFECQPQTAMQKLPLGLTLAEDGTLIGNPSFQDTGAYTFLVLVTDDEGRRDLRSLSIRLQPTPIESGGCSGTAAAPTLLLSLLALAGIRRKKAAP